MSMKYYRGGERAVKGAALYTVFFLAALAAAPAGAADKQRPAAGEAERERARRISEMEGVERSTAAARVPALKLFLDDADPAVRGEAAAALGKVRGEEAFSALTEALESKDQNVRLGAIEGLAAGADPRAADRLAGLLKDPSVNIRWKAALALGALKNEAALPELERAARADAEGNVRVAAVESIGRIGGPGAESALKKMAGGKDRRLAGWAGNVLKAMR